MMKALELMGKVNTVKHDHPLAQAVWKTDGLVFPASV
jgi:hypothetical protein